MVTFADSEKERVRLVESDYETTNEFIKGVVGTGALIRGSAITIWLALVGFAFQQSLTILAVLAAVVALVFAVVDGYYGWLYAEAAKHLRACEKVISTYYNALSRGDDDEDAVRDFRQELRFHRFGLFLNLRIKMKWDFLLAAKPVMIYRVIYPGLILLAIASALAIGPGGAGKKESEAEKATKTEPVTITQSLTVEQRTQITTLVTKLEHSSNPSDRQLAKVLLEDLKGTPEAIAAVAKFAEETGSLSEKAALEVIKGLTAIASSSLAHGGGVSIANLGGPTFTFSGPEFTFQSPSSGKGSTGVECVDYLVELDTLVDDDAGVVNKLPGHELPSTAGARACGLSGPLGSDSPIIAALTKR